MSNYLPNVSKRQRLYDSRVIRQEISDPAFTNPPRGKNIEKKIIQNQSIPNKLDIPTYLQSRQDEIITLENAMIKSRTAGSTRVFQSLPRSLRRRTASHNVKRIPKRMRWKALKEMGVSTVAATTTTKGITPAGRPIAKKQHRGRTRFSIQRKIKLLKYSLKWKVNGKLLDGEWVSNKNVKIGERIKQLRKELMDLHKPSPQNPFSESNDSDLVSKHRYQAFEALNGKVLNQTGAHDNTSVNDHSKQHKITSLKYATRQAQYKWLPTHVWHAKRSKMVKRWDWAMAYKPTMKNYRLTSRQSRINGGLLQDVSFINTMVINSNRDQIDKLHNFVRLLTKGNANKSKFQKLVWNGLFYINDEPIGYGEIMWSNTSELSRCIIRCHPIIYLKIFNYALKGFENDDSVSIHDCKYSIGGISIQGPKSLLAIQSILHQRDNSKDGTFGNLMSLGKLNDINLIPNGTCLSFNVADPRFWPNQKPQPKNKFSHVQSSEEIINYEHDEDLNNEEDIIEKIIELRQKSNLNNSDLFSIDKRSKSYINQLSNKLLDSRRHDNIGKPIPLESNDPSIPIVLYRSNDKWTILMPWFWVLPFWLKLTQIPHMNFIGLKQNDQLAFERSQVGLNDMIFTKDGYIQSQIELDLVKFDWQKKPKSHRIQYDKLNVSPTGLGEILCPFGQDWRALQTIRLATQRIASSGQPKMSNEPIKDDKLNIVPQKLSDILPLVKSIQLAEQTLKESNNHQILLDHMPVKLSTVPSSLAATDKNFTFSITKMPPLEITGIKFSCESYGNIEPNARIYQIPSNQLYKLDLKSDPIEESIFDEKKVTAIWETPSLENIIGLVTSGGFNLTKGFSTGIGFVDSSSLGEKDTGICLIRNVASDKPALVKWEKLVF